MKKDFGGTESCVQVVQLHGGVNTAGNMMNILPKNEGVACQSGHLKSGVVPHDYKNLKN